MPTLEEQIVAQTTAAQALTQEVVGKMGAIDVKTAQSQADVASYIAAARMEAPFFRVSPNQRMAAITGGAGAVPDGFQSDAALNWSTRFSIATGPPEAQDANGGNSVEYNALFADIGVAPANNVVSINCMHVTGAAPAAAINFFNRQYLHSASALSRGMLIRVRSGVINVFNNYVVPQDNTWRLVGKTFPAKRMYNHAWCTISPGAAVDFDVLLPADLVGKYDFSGAEKWWLFPHLAADNT